MTTELIQTSGWELRVDEREEPRVRDIDLGARLGFARPRDFRKLIERLRRDGILNDIDCGATEARQLVPASGGYRLYTEYWLSEIGALLSIAKSETATANAITRQVVELYVAVRRGRYQKATEPKLTSDLMHGVRIGETVLRDELQRICRIAASTAGVSVHKIHGAVRKQFRVPSPYAVSQYLWEVLRMYIASLTKDAFRALPAARPENDTRQRNLFAVG